MPLPGSILPSNTREEIKTFGCCGKRTRVSEWTSTTMQFSIFYTMTSSAVYLYLSIAMRLYQFVVVLFSCHKLKQAEYFFSGQLNTLNIQLLFNSKLMFLTKLTGWFKIRTWICGKLPPLPRLKPMSRTPVTLQTETTEEILLGPINHIFWNFHFNKLKYLSL